MILQTFKSPQKDTPVIASVTGQWKNGYGYITAARKADQLKISLEEFHRRDTIVRNMYNKCPSLKIGLKYKPIDERKQKEYGVCTLKEIFTSYFDFPLTEPWPDNDYPYLLTVQPENDDSLILATHNWLNPIPIDE